MNNIIRILLVNTADDAVQECFARLSYTGDLIKLCLADGKYAVKSWRECWADKALLDSQGRAVPCLRIVA